MRATIDNAIRIPIDDMEEEIWRDIEPLLAIPNRERIEAQRQKRYGWTEMPEMIHLWDVEDDHVVIPRGFRDPLERGFEHYGIEVQWTDNRTRDSLLRTAPPFPQYRSFQQPGARALLDAQEGIVEAPAGSGKSVMGLELVRVARQRHNLIVVNEIGIARQWLKEAEDFLGPDFGYGMIGGGEWTEGRLTLATLQTLYAKKDEIPEEWWRKHGVVLLDECHHQTARTFLEIMSLFWAMIRGGLSATPDKTGDFDIAQAVLGDVVHRTTRHQLRDEGILMRPTIHVVDTEFSFDYWGTHDATLKTKYVCQKPGCPLSGKKRHGHQNNYSKLLKALVEDEDRNGLIASKIKLREGHRQIVISKQTKQLRAIREAMERAGVDSEVIWLTGDVSEEDRVAARDRIQAATDGCVVLTTIADEAFNAPALDTLHMPFPTRNVGAHRQRIGRVERFWPGKEDPWVFDYRDPIGVMHSQFRERRWGVYAEERYLVIATEREEI